MNLSGNTILITGGASGIGLAIAKMFAQNSNRVIIAGRNKTKLQEAAQLHPDISSLVCDISRQDDLEKLVLTLSAEHPDINVLINNAAVQYNYYLTEESNPYKRIDEEISINFTAVVKLTAMMLPLLSTKESAVVTLTSGLAFAPKENAAVYCASKAAVHNFTTVLRYQLEKMPVKVFELIPPLVDTAMTTGRGSDKMSPQQVTEIFKEAWIKNRYEINVGKIKMMRRMLRWFPGLIMKKLRYSI